MPNSSAIEQRAASTITFRLASLTLTDTECQQMCAAKILAMSGASGRTAFKQNSKFQTIEKLLEAMTPASARLVKHHISMSHWSTRCGICETKPFNNTQLMLNAQHVWLIVLSLCPLRAKANCADCEVHFKWASTALRSRSKPGVSYVRSVHDQHKSNLHTIHALHLETSSNELLQTVREPCLGKQSIFWSDLILKPSCHSCMSGFYYFNPTSTRPANSEILFKPSTVLQPPISHKSVLVDCY